MSDEPTFAIVGAGLAGAKAAEALRAEGFDGRIVLLGAEPHRPYERPPLSKGYLQGSADRDTVYVHPPEWYAEHDVDLRLGTAVTAHRPPRPRARDLPTATGCATTSCCWPPAPPRAGCRCPAPTSAACTTCARLDDSDQLKAALRPGTRVVIIGGGLDRPGDRRRGPRAPAPRSPCSNSAELPLLRVLGPQVAQVFADLHTEHGVDLRCGVTVAAIRPAGTDPTTAGGVQLADGTDAGRRRRSSSASASPPTSSWPESCRAQRRQRHPRRRAPAHLRPRHLRRRRRRQRLPPAAGPPAPRRALGQRAAPAGRRRQGDARPRPPPTTGCPYFFTDQYDLGMEYTGYAEPDGYDQVVIRGDLHAPRVHRVLATRRPRAGRDERQHLGRHRADPGS